MIARPTALGNCGAAAQGAKTKARYYKQGTRSDREGLGLSTAPDDMGEGVWRVHGPNVDRGIDGARTRARST